MVGLESTVLLLAVVEMVAELLASCKQSLFSFPRIKYTYSLKTIILWAS